MLVLSRRANEKIVFPNLGVTIQVTNIAKGAVRLGIDAPSSVTVMREEIVGQSQEAPPAAAKSPGHRLRNHLHTATLAVHLAQKQLTAGRTAAAEETLNNALRECAALDRELASGKLAVAAAKRGIRTLLVEDNKNECALLAEFLRLHGMTVVTANDGQDALDYLRSNERPDVILLDIRMPRCDGPTTLAAIRHYTHLEGTKIFAVTGTNPADCALPTEGRGVDGWFTKPVNPLHLIREMNQVLGRN